MKLRERYLAEYPEDATRIDRLARVPSAFRHLLTLRLELRRADALPNRYRELATRQVSTGSDPLDTEPQGDEVDQLVTAFAAAFGTVQAPSLLARLHRYFTESQLVELMLVITMARAFAEFDALQLVQFPD